MHNTIQALTKKIDVFQQRHMVPAFIYAVVKKYGEDEVGYQAALLTYYGFLSLFPLLLVLTTLTTLISDKELQHTVVHSVTDYFPVLGDQLSSHVNMLHKSGLALAIGIVFTLYGARGVADAFRHGVNHVWGVPRLRRDGFPKNMLKSFALMLIGGFGLIVASVGAGLAASAGHGWDFRLLSMVVNAFILFWLFTFLLEISLADHVTVRETKVGAITAAVGLVILQTFGGYLLARQLRNLDALYSYFAVALGLLFWLYLQAQVLYYSVEIAAVHAHRLWPRSLTEETTHTDRAALAQQAKKERMVPEEEIHTPFKPKD